MTTQDLINGLKEKSKIFFDKKEFMSAGKINMVIDLLENTLEDEQKSDSLKELEIFKIYSNNLSKIGWNNFDAEVINGYSIINPKESWPGRYVHIYLVSNEIPKTGDWIYNSGKVIKKETDIEGKKIEMTNDLSLENIPKVPESFEKAFAQARGMYDRVLVDSSLEIIKVKKWSAGKTSDWLKYISR